MTLVEILISLMIFGLLASGAFSFMRQQTEAVARGDDWMTVLQNQRFAIGLLDRELRNVGTGVPAQQPFLIYADTNVIAFNVDLVTRDPDERYGAVYLDVNARPEETVAVTREQRFQIPLTTVHYPDTTYLNGGVNSGAETIVFFFEPDISTPRPDDYVLFRQVNGLAPEVVARELVRVDQRPFFEYFRVAASDGSASLQQIDEGPLHHSVAIHGSPADTGQAALIDEVRAIQVNFASARVSAGGGEQSSVASRQVRLPNAGARQAQTCGARPLFNSSLTLSSFEYEGSPAVRLEWDQATDEAEGERDVLRYVIWRVTDPSQPWSNPLSSVGAAGTDSYAYEDYSVQPGTTYHYGLAAQDCSPALSSIVSASITTPTP